MTITPLLVGPRVRLAPLSSVDSSTIARWQTDNEYLRLLDSNPAFPKNESQIAEWMREGQRGRENFLFGIRTLNEDFLIGFLELGEILWTHRTTWLAIGIGESDYRDVGYGHEAIGLALEFAFRELNLHRVQLTVFGYNLRAIALYEKLGFQREGTFREFLDRDNQRHDMYLYGILRHEWDKR
ncbi:MAG: GNAT family N-acetyltransferase [Anaerolineae bacterium]|nr:GNAT family N-acetyltransferase [Anaerolineae bacterium]